MSIEKFIGKPKKAIIQNEEVDIYPLQFKDTDLVAKLESSDMTEKGKTIIELVKRSLKKSFPNATDEQIDSIELKYLGEFISAVFDASGLEIDKKKFNDMMASSRQAI